MKNIELSVFRISATNLTVDCSGTAIDAELKI